MPAVDRERLHQLWRPARFTQVDHVPPWANKEPQANPALIGILLHEEVHSLTALAIQPQPVPLVKDQAGRLMVPGTRIFLDVLVTDFKRGKTPESIHEAYATVPLADVYAILAFYLRHRHDVEAYLTEQERQGTDLQARIESSNPPDGLRARLLARLDS